jgi:hypothetical protein
MYHDVMYYDDVKYDSLCIIAMEGRSVDGERQRERGREEKRKKNGNYTELREIDRPRNMTGK